MRTLLAWVAIATLAGCALGPDYARPVVDLPAGYPAAEPDGPAALRPGRQWWTLYGDAKLDELVATALERNPDVALAVARIEETNAQLREAGAAFLPEIDAGLSASRSRLSAATAFPNPSPLVRNDVKLQLTTAFELDFWGKLRRAREAARAQVLGSGYAREVVALSLESLVAQSYFTLRSLDAQIVLASRTLQSRQDSLDVVNARRNGGLASDLESNQAATALADASLQLRDLFGQRDLAEHQLALLAGQPGLRLVPEPGGAMPPALPQLPAAGLPSSLLERRPDVQQAEQALVAANAQVGIARAAYFPTVTLIAGDGGESTALARVMGGAARIWSVGPGVAMPLLEWERTSARVSGAQARRDQAMAGYRKSVETAFREVADALTAVRTATQAQRDLDGRSATAHSTLELANARYKSGYSAYLEVLDAQRSANDAELAATRNRLALLNASVSLMKAIGGGWRPGGET